MYRILLTDNEFAALNNERIDSVAHMTSAEMQLGYLLGRAQYLEGMVIGEYTKPTEIPVSGTGTPNVLETNGTGTNTPPVGGETVTTSNSMNHGEEMDSESDS